VKLLIFSSQDTYDWLLNSNAANKRPGAWIEIGIDTTKGSSLADYVSVQREKLAAKKFRITSEDTIRLANTEAVRINYTFPLTSKTSLFGFDIVALQDSIPTYIEYAGVGKAFDENKVVIDTVLSTIRLAQKLAKRQISEASGPSESPATHSDRYLEFKYPDNYNQVGVQQGNNLWVYELRSAARLDCSIHFDIFDAKKLTVERVFDQNKVKYKVRSTGQTTLDGQKALFLNYAARPDVDCRVYFTVKNDRAVRVTFTWYKPQEAAYLAAYEKVLSSLRIK
jgi:hypothetical protein